MKSRLGKWIGFVVLLLILVGGPVFYIFRNDIFVGSYEVADDLDGNFFPSLILSLANNDTLLIQPSDTLYLGNPKSYIGIRITPKHSNSRVKVTVEATPFFSRTETEFFLPQAKKSYLLYPNMAWNFEELKNNVQPIPVSVTVGVSLDGKELQQEVHTMMMRSINDCIIGYNDRNGKFKETSIMFAAYVNEENPQIDKILREALNTRIVNRFSGYQSQRPNAVQNQVYALWNVLQKRDFKYSSISVNSLASNKVFAQRVRPVGDAIESAQINCVDGCCLFASLLKAINIDPILVRTPSHMFIGYYLDKAHTKKEFLELTLIGDVNLDDYFPEEQLDSTLNQKSQNEISRITFDKSREYAAGQYEKVKDKLEAREPSYVMFEISKAVRRDIQPIGR